MSKAVGNPHPIDNRTPTDRAVLNEKIYQNKAMHEMRSKAKKLADLSHIFKQRRGDQLRRHQYPRRVYILLPLASKGRKFKKFYQRCLSSGKNSSTEFSDKHSNLIDEICRFKMNNRLCDGNFIEFLSLKVRRTVNELQ